MEWPRQPVESIARAAFRPEHCPNPRCEFHRRPGGRFRRRGLYPRKGDGRSVQRFDCLHCDKSFSQQTFSTTYYLKRPELLVPVAAGLVAGSAHRQLARSLGCAPSTVTRLSARLGRHAMLLQAWLLESVGPLVEPVVYDHFISFVGAQNQRVALGTPVGARSWFGFGLDWAALRGKTTRRRKRALDPSHGKRGALRRATGATLDLLGGHTVPRQPIELHTDGHPAYRSALARHARADRFTLFAWPNPRSRRKSERPSRSARLRDRAMFAADLLHKIIRHTHAHHRRETIAFGRRLNALVERAFQLLIWRNLIKARTERRPDPTTPAMWLGLTAEPWSWTRVLARRLFPARLAVPPTWMVAYRRELPTRTTGQNQRHTCVNAF